MNDESRAYDSGNQLLAVTSGLEARGVAMAEIMNSAIWSNPSSAITDSLKAVYQSVAPLDLEVQKRIRVNTKHAFKFLLELRVDPMEKHLN